MTFQIEMLRRTPKILSFLEAHDFVDTFVSAMAETEKYIEGLNRKEAYWEVTQSPSGSVYIQIRGVPEVLHRLFPDQWPRVLHRFSNHPIRAKEGVVYHFVSHLPGQAPQRLGAAA